MPIRSHTQLVDARAHNLHFIRSTADAHIVEIRIVAGDEQLPPPNAVANRVDDADSDPSDFDENYKDYDVDDEALADDDLASELDDENEDEESDSDD